MKKRFLITILAIFSLISGVAFAQTSSGSIIGRVVDQSNAVITDIQVTLTNQLTGDVRTATTDKEGQFLFLALQPGTFVVSVQAEGFKRFEKRDLVLTASDRLSAGVLQLEVGATTQSTTVTAEVSTVQTETSERSAQIDAKEMQTLMSVGRDPLSLLRVLPGVVNDGGGSSGGLGTENVGYVAGVRQEHNSVSIDGVSGNPRGDGNKLDTPVNMDAVQEIKVVLNSYQAEYGQSAGAIVNMTTKSGTQDFHGGAYYYGRNEAFNANSWFNNHNGKVIDGVYTPVNKGRYRYNTYGFTIGGPVYIPKTFNMSKQKLFFFFSQEHWPTKGSTGPQRYMMPTALERAGDFSKTRDYKGNPVYIRDPQLSGNCGTKKSDGTIDTTACFPGNVIPAARINLNTQKIMNVFPLPTIDCVVGTCPLTGGTSGDPYNYEITGDTNTPSTQNLLRLDYNLNSKWHMYFRGMMVDKTNEGLTSTTNKHQWGIPSYYKTPSKNAGINLTYVASSTLVNEFTVGYSSWNELNDFLNPADLDKLSRSALGVTLGQNNPSQNPLDLLPRITGMSSGGSNGTYQLKLAPEINFDNRFPMNSNTGTWEFTDGLTKVWNRHTFKGGIYFQAGRYIQRHGGSVFSGNFNFGANSSSPYDTQYAYSNLLLGSYGSYQEGSNYSNYAPHWNILEWYGQDTWKVKSNITLNYGLRFTYDLPTQLQKGFGAGFVPEGYDPSQVPAMYKPVAYTGLTAAQQRACAAPYKTGTKISRCALNPVTGAIMPDTYINTFVTPFDFTGTVLNTDPSYPSSLRWGNGVLLAPRFGISWDPFKDGKTAIRFGTGLYYNTREGGGTVGDYSQVPPTLLNSSIGFGQLTGTNFQPSCNTTDSCYGTAAIVNSTPLDTRILQPHRKIESTLGVNLGVQRKVGFDTVVDVAYVGTFGRHLSQQINLNAIPYGAQLNPNYDPNVAGSSPWNSAWIDPSQSSQNCYYGSGSTTSATTYCQPKLVSDNFFRPYLGYGAINLRDYGSTSNYNALQTSVNRRFTKGLQFGASYTWSKTMTYADAPNAAVANFEDRRFWNYGEASFDRTHNLVFHWTANVPKASSLWNNSVLRAIGDNWEWSGIAQFVSGAPLSLSFSGNPNLTGGGDGSRPILIGDAFAPKDDLHNTTQYINKLVWVMPCAPGLPAALVATAHCVPTGLIPNADIPGITRANIGRGPGTNNWDMALQKNISIREQMKFTIRVEAFNIFNHVSFTQVDTGSNSGDTGLAFDNSSSCGTSCGLLKSASTSRFGQVTAERGARKLQLSARFTF